MLSHVRQNVVLEQWILEQICDYFCLRAIPNLHDDVFSTVVAAVYRMQLNYISSLAKGSKTAIDVEQLANDVTLEFLDRYLLRGRVILIEKRQLISLLKTIARTRLINSFRNGRRSRLPSQRPGVGPLASIDLVADNRQPFAQIEFKEFYRELESILTDQNLVTVFRLMAKGFSTMEIADTLDIALRASQRLVKQVRDELRPWCESEFRHIPR